MKALNLCRDRFYFDVTNTGMVLPLKKEAFAKTLIIIAFKANVPYFLIISNN